VPALLIGLTLPLTPQERVHREETAKPARAPVPV
jgi:hypothetical protein